MNKVIQDMWIIEENGMVLYSHVLDKKVDEVLFGGLMAALNMFAEQLSQEGIKSIELQNFRFHLLKQDRLLFIANCEKKEKEKKLQKELAKIADNFIQLYGQELDHWDNNSNRFLDFEEKIKKNTKKPLEEFWKAF